MGWTMFALHWSTRLASVLVLAGGYAFVTRRVMKLPNAYKVIVPTTIVGLLGMEYYDT
jgi:hypothetical protein